MRFFSSPESVDQGEPSWLAVLETVWATLLCWGIVWRSGSLLPVLIPLFVTPLLLLRSAESTAKGARWFAVYLEDKTEVTPTGKPLPFWGLWVPLIIWVTSTATTWMADHLLLNHTDWALFVRAVLVGVVAVWIAMTLAVAGALAGSVVIALTVAFSLAVGAAQSGVMEVAFAWAFTVTLGAVVAGILALLWMGAVAGEGELAIAIVLAGIPWILGVWLRSLGVRLLATLCHPWQGLRAMPGNWRRISWVLDSGYPPELVPGLSFWTPAFSLKEIQAIFHSHGLLRKLFGLLAFLCFFLPAILYRWSLKSTVWLYWPLLFLEAMPEQSNPERVEQWRFALQKGHWEGMRRGLSIVLGSVLWFLLLTAATPWQRLIHVIDARIVLAWQGSVLGMILLTLCIYGVSRFACQVRVLYTLQRLRNINTVVLLLLTMACAFFLFQVRAS
ncbi:MAG: hypothetical protein HQL88_01895 [Magnetococcales bacterium]|nr:hypothetical protein [Magnetococcales bacterium]